ncbi:MAG: class III signal peptide-containing protein [Candidatus ainarchaeum sp.]|nr:class III signal peptide-containing protein [Candidatus ainarchaeum sp.]MDD3975881.1 class III signal peptide-containing protein [Candidatus ainarchaeum sp.]
MVLKNKKGQSSLEYMLIIGGALLVAIIVITVVLSLGNANKDSAESTNQDYQYLIDSTIIPPIITNVDCNIDSNITIYLNTSTSKNISGYKIIVDDFLPYPSGLDVIYETSGVVSQNANSLGINTVGQIYNISIVAIKNNSSSRPSMPSMSCKAHN